jgi:hypothetical protein
MLFYKYRENRKSQEGQQNTLFVQDVSRIHSPFPRVYRGMDKLADLPKQQETKLYSRHGIKVHVAFGNRRGRMIGFMFW